MPFSHLGALRQEPVQKQALCLHAAMYQSLQILKMPTCELQNYIYEQMYTNPLLDMDYFETQNQEGLTSLPEHPCTGSAIELRFGETGGYSTAQKYYEQEDEPPLIEKYPSNGFSGYTSELTWSLMEQLHLIPLPDQKRRICTRLIECLDARGYMSCDLNELAQQWHVSFAEVEEALAVIQTFEPTGIGARSLEECLLLQLSDSGSLNQDLSDIVLHMLPEVAMGNTNTLCDRLGCDEKRVIDYIRRIRSLNPNPARGYDNGARSIYIIPDAYIKPGNVESEISMNLRASQGLRINNDYECLIQNAQDRTDVEYLRQQRQDAQSLIRSIRDRNETLRRVIACIVELQPVYFTDGFSLKAMTLNDIAEKLSLNQSTVSRAIQDKYIVCKAGVVSLKSLFSTGVAGNNGTTVSNVMVRKKLLLYIQYEDCKHPLSDEELRIQLEQEGISVSRRVIAKYREAMGIPCSPQRRKSYLVNNH